MQITSVSKTDMTIGSGLGVLLISVRQLVWWTSHLTCDRTELKSQLLRSPLIYSQNYTHSAEFAAAGYQPLLVDGVEYGEVRQYGNLSFTRVYEAGHEVPYVSFYLAAVTETRTVSLIVCSINQLPHSKSSTAP